jgi:PHD/YefM family antitoxin component YafN of YafNO toxin-antitoxin module
MSGTAIPYIDPNVEYAGVSRLRKLNSGQLEKLDKTLVLQDKDNPLAVLVRYEQYLMMQEQLRKLENTIELLTNAEEVAGLIEGLRALKQGRSRSLKAVRGALKKGQ